MKYAIILPDGAADEPVEKLGGRTPLEVAQTPHMDWVSSHGRQGCIRTVPEGFLPGSDVATLSLLGYDPKTDYTGRAPLEAVAREGQHEIGLHANLMPGSTQGMNLDSICDRLQQAYPQAVGNRFHLLAHSYRDLVALGRRSFMYDVSALRFNCPYVIPAWHPDLRMVLFTYTWEDGICENARLPMRLSSLDLDSPGMKIINIHPMNVYINGSDARARLTFLQENPDLLDCPQSVAETYRQRGDGAESVLTALLERLARQRRATLKLKDVATAFKGTQKQNKAAA
ncbi:MAG: hypothetical protein IID33_06340 [Planctomycetes bacterium]|nr:hypothetical protein [Planctomycetota bacterium]